MKKKVMQRQDLSRHEESLKNRFRLPSGTSGSQRSNPKDTTRSLARQPSRCALNVQACCYENHFLPREKKIVGVTQKSHFEKEV